MSKENKKLETDIFKKLQSNLKKSVHFTPEVRLILGIIEQAIKDLKGDDVDLSKDAKKYFKGPVFREHCDLLKVSSKTFREKYGV